MIINNSSLTLMRVHRGVGAIFHVIIKARCLHSGSSVRRREGWKRHLLPPPLPSPILPRCSVPRHRLPVLYFSLTCTSGPRTAAYRPPPLGHSSLERHGSPAGMGLFPPAVTVPAPPSSSDVQQLLYPIDPGRSCVARSSENLTASVFVPCSVIVLVWVAVD